MTKNWHDLSQEAKNEVVCKAHEFHMDHKPYVARLVEGQKARYAPSLGDLLRPELWKGAHWAWFIRGGE